MTSVEFDNAKTVHVNGTTLAYCELGEGEPVLFAHGALSDQRIWRAQQEALGRRYRAIAYSCRHHGPTTPAPPGADLGFAAHVDDLQALMTKIDAAPAHLVGNSSGGLLCLLGNPDAKPRSLAPVSRRRKAHGSRLLDGGRSQHNPASL